MDQYSSKQVATATTAMKNRHHQHISSSGNMNHPHQQQQQPQRTIPLQEQPRWRSKHLTLNSNTTTSSRDSYSVPRSVSNDDDDDDDDDHYDTTTGSYYNENKPPLQGITSSNNMKSHSIMKQQQQSIPNTSTRISNNNMYYYSNNNNTNVTNNVGTSSVLLTKQPQISSLTITQQPQQQCNIDNNNTIVVEQYLQHYEAMVQQQGMEEQMVLQHMIPCIHRFQEIIQLHVTSNMTSTGNNNNSRPSNKRKTTNSNNNIRLYDEISYQQLHQVYMYLEQIHKSPSSLSSTNDTTTLTITPYECMTTDRQLMMVLRTLTEHNMELQLLPVQDISNQQTQAQQQQNTISWIELIHCYRICIIGMMTLQHLPKGSMARIRTRERSLSMIHLFTSNTSSSSNNMNNSSDLLYPNVATSSLLSTTTTTSTTIPSSNLNFTNSSTTALPFNNTNSTTSHRRRRWFKKRTIRMLPYLIGMILFTITTIGCGIYFSYNSHHGNRLHNIEKMIDVQENNEEQLCMIMCDPFTSSVTTTSFPYCSINDETIIVDRYNDHDNSNNNNVADMMMNTNHTSSMTMIVNNDEVMDYQKSTTKMFKKQHLHPLLGIWSNFI